MSGTKKLVTTKLKDLEKLDISSIEIQIQMLTLYARLDLHETTNTKLEEVLANLQHVDISTRNIKDIERFLNACHSNYIPKYLSAVDERFQIIMKKYEDFILLHNLDHTILREILMQYPDKSRALQLYKQDVQTIIQGNYVTNADVNTVLNYTSICNKNNDATNCKNIITKMYEKTKIIFGIFHPLTLKLASKVDQPNVMENLKREQQQVLEDNNQPRKDDQNSETKDELHDSNDTSYQPKCYFKEISREELLDSIPEKGHVEVVPARFDDADIERNDNIVPIALMSAASQGNVRVVTALLDRGADVNHKDNNGDTALMLAAKQGHVEVVTLLLDRGADVNHKNKDGSTALMLACTRDDVKVVTALLDRGADVNHKDNNGVTALMLAAVKGHVEVVTLLLDRGADVNHNKDNNGVTALMLAAVKGHVEVVTRLLDRGADVNHNKDNNGVTALMYAASKGHVEVVTLLLDRGADVNHKNNNGVTVLMYAASKGHVEVVTLLLDRGADVNHNKDKYGGTALMLAASEGHVEVVTLLLDRGAIMSIT